MSAEEARALHTSRRRVALLDSAPLCDLCSCFDEAGAGSGRCEACSETKRYLFRSLCFKGYLRFVGKLFTVERD